MAQQRSPAWLSFLSHYVTLTSHLSSFCTSVLICSPFLHPCQVCWDFHCAFLQARPRVVSGRQTPRWNLSITQWINQQKLQGSKIIIRKKIWFSALKLYETASDTTERAIFVLFFRVPWRHSRQKWNVLSLSFTFILTFNVKAQAASALKLLGLFIFNSAEVAIRSKW